MSSAKSTMFTMFELAKVFQFNREDVTPKEHKRVVNHAWKDVGKRTALALMFSNGHLLFWHAAPNQMPVFHQMVWFPKKPVLSMCYDFSGIWLLCCTSQSIFIVPAFSLLQTSAVVEKTWATNDVTEIKLPKIKGHVTCSCWWHTFKDEPIALLGTDVGIVYMVNLSTKRVVHEVSVHEHMLSICLVRDHILVATYAMITSKNNNQWKVLLEQKVEVPQLTTDRDMMAWSTKPSQVRAQLKKIYTYKTVFQKPDDVTPEEQKPLQILSASQTSVLSVQNAKGQHFITSHNLQFHIYKVYEIHMQQSPVYVYQLPESQLVGDVLYTDKLMFVTAIDRHHTLSVVANQLAEAMGDEARNQSTVQKFEMPPGEEILAVHKHVFPKNWHKLGSVIMLDAETSWLDSLKDLTVLDGCMILTNMAVYICKPRVVPEILFLNKIFEKEEFSHAERLGYILGLDLNHLYQVAAEISLKERKDCAVALEIFERSRSPATEQMTMLLKYDFVKEAMPVISQLVTAQGINELPPEQRVIVSSVAVRCYIHQILRVDKCLTRLKADFRNFLFTNYFLDNLKVLQMLFRYGLSKLFVDFAQERDIFFDAIKLLLDENTDYQSSVVDDGDPDICAAINIPDILDQDVRTKSKYEILVELLDVHELLLLLEEDPNYGPKLAAVLLEAIPNCQEDQLLKLLDMFDLSKPPWKKWCHIAMNSFISDNSDDESIEEEDQTMVKAEDKAIKGILDIFLHALIYINHGRTKSYMLTLDDCSDLPQREATDTDFKLKSAVAEKVVCRPTVISCGQDFTALVRNGDLYTWGCTKDGRLGQGPQQVEMECTPHIVKAFSRYGITVSSVACGGNHALAITNKGLFGWGSSQYGQVGTGKSCCTYNSPANIQLPEGTTVASVSCGQYHSAALMSDFRLYTWGWGVHGQLGHGNAEDIISPKCVISLQGVQVVMVTAGYAHTAVLTSEGHVFTFGCSTFGQLGRGSTTKSSVPLKVTSLPEPVSMISSKYFHCMALSTSGKLYTWGSSPLQLRQEVTSLKKARNTRQKSKSLRQNKHLLPKLVNRKEASGKITQVCAGTSFSAVLTANGCLCTWGNNSDGQLGTGTTMTESVPFCVPGLNDTCMATMATGSNFVVALDFSGDIYSWGNNDKGQLCVRPRNPGVVRQKQVKEPQALLGNPFAHVRMMTDSNTVVEPVRINSTGLSRVKNLCKFKEELYSAALPDAWRFEHLSRISRPVHSDRRLPDLVGTGPVTYPPTSIFTTLRHLRQWVNPHQLLHVCRNLEDWDSAEMVALFLEEYNMAFDYHLKHLDTLKQTLDVNHEAAVITAVYQYITFHKDKFCYSHRHSLDALFIFCHQLLHLWTSQKFSVLSLQTVIMKHCDILSLPFILSLVHKSDCEDLGRPSLMCADSVHIGGRFISSIKQEFVPNFTLAILKTASSQINEGQPKSVFLDRHIRALFPEVDSVPQENKLIEKEKLWQDINQHLTKDSSLCQSSTHISKQELLQTIGDSSIQSNRSSPSFTEGNVYDFVQDKPTSAEQQTLSVIFFSCGHHARSSHLFDTLIPDLELKLTNRDPPLVKTASMLSYQYRTSGKIKMACPVCVYATIAKM